MAKKREPTNLAKIRLNELGKQWKLYSPVEDKAAYEARWLEIWTALFDIYYPYLQTEPQLNAFEKTLEQVREKFDADKGTLSAFFSTHLNWNTVDATKKEMKENPLDRIDGSPDPYGSETDDVDQRITRDTATLGGIDDVEGEFLMNSALVELSGQILHFSENHGKKNGNPLRRNYFQLFYTSGVTSFVKMDKDAPSFQHQRDIEAAMKVPFVDYCMIQRCRTLFDIYEGDLKQYGAVVEGLPSDKQKSVIPLPVPDQVGRSYLKNVENLSVSKSTYSEQKSAYKAEMKEMFELKGIL